MNQEIKRRWVEALRSGQYKQGRLHLHKEDSFCCLGVLTDLYCRDHGAQWSEAWPGSLVMAFNGEDEGLHPMVLDWAGLSSPNPVVDCGRLSSLNDNGRTFAEIADLIDQHL
jgi:hypothetical protein